MIIYPLNMLPPPLIIMSGATNPVLATTQFEIAVRQREIYSYAEQDMSLQILINDFQFEFFKSWVKNVLKSGSLSFQIPLPGVSGINVSEIKILNGTLDWAKDSDLWRVSFNARQENPILGAVGTVEFLASLADGNEEDFSSMADLLHLQLNSFYGISTDSPLIASFINAHN